MIIVKGYPWNNYKKHISQQWYFKILWPATTSQP